MHFNNIKQTCQKCDSTLNNEKGPTAQYVSACHQLTLSVSVSLSLFLSQEAIITGLLAETTYSVTVAAYTTKGDGARSKAKIVTTTGAGETVFYSSHSLRVYSH